jgi:hypothetical protein
VGGFNRCFEESAMNRKTLFCYLAAGLVVAALPICFRELNVKAQGTARGAAGPMADFRPGSQGAEGPERGRRRHRPVVAANAETLFVLRGHTLASYDPRTLALRKEVELPEPEQPEPPSAQPTPPEIRPNPMRREPVSPPARGEKSDASRGVDLRQMWSGGRTVGTGPVRLANFGMRVEDIGRVSPMGLIVGAHVTPRDHLGIQPKRSDAPRDHYDVLAPADGYVVMIQHRTQNIGDPAAPGQPDQYRVVLEHSGTFWTYLDLIDRLSVTLEDALGAPIEGQGSVRLRVPVKAGQVIGKTGGDHGLDLGVVNTQVTLKGFRFTERYEDEPWKIHSVDPFDYIDEPARSELLALNPRKSKPYGGRIDFDISGRLLGNWYREGQDQSLDRTSRNPWVGQLSVVPHYLDSSTMVFSTGDFGGRIRDLAIRHPTPHPGLVSARHGVVEYELVSFTSPSSATPLANPEALPAAYQGVHGVALVQVLEGDRLRVELFPGKTASEVEGFTDSSRIYKR